MDNIIQPCPDCHSKEIGVMDMIIQTPWRGDAKKVWAYCHCCGRKSPEIICDISINKQDEIAQAYEAWNRIKEGTGVL